jgi:hypothetical protein
MTKKTEQQKKQGVSRWQQVKSTIDDILLSQDKVTTLKVKERLQAKYKHGFNQSMVSALVISANNAQLANQIRKGPLKPLLKLSPELQAAFGNLAATVDSELGKQARVAAAAAKKAAAQKPTVPATGRANGATVNVIKGLTERKILGIAKKALTLPPILDVFGFKEADKKQRLA